MLIEKAVVLVQAELMRHHDISREDIEIGLELNEDEDGDTLGCYYIADTRKEDTFWLHPIAASFLSDTDSVKILGKEHLGMYAVNKGFAALERPLLLSRLHHGGGLLVFDSS